MFQAPVSSSFVSSSYPDSTAYCPEGGFVPGMNSVAGNVENCRGNEFGAFSYFEPEQGSQEQEMQEPAIDAAELFAPRAPEVVKAEPVAVPVPCTSSPTNSDVVSEVTVIGATPSFAPGAEASVTGSCVATPIGCDDEYSSGRAVSDSSESFSELPKGKRENSPMNNEIEQLGSVVKSLSYNCTLSLGCKLPVKQIVSQLVNVDWSPKHPNKATVRLNNGVTGHISSNGTVQIKNARCRLEAQMSMSSFVRKLKKVCPAVAKVSVTQMRVSEISAQCSMGFGVNVMDMDVEGLDPEHVVSSNYDTNSCPGRTIHLRNPRATLILYHTGNFRVCGVNSHDDLKEVVSLACDYSRKNTL